MASIDYIGQTSSDSQFEIFIYLGKSNLLRVTCLNKRLHEAVENRVFKPLYERIEGQGAINAPWVHSYGGAFQAHYLTPDEIKVRDGLIEQYGKGPIWWLSSQSQQGLMKKIESIEGNYIWKRTIITSIKIDRLLHKVSHLSALALFWVVAGKVYRLYSDFREQGRLPQTSFSSLLDHLRYNKGMNSLTVLSIMMVSTFALYALSVVTKLYVAKHYSSEVRDKYSNFFKFFKSENVKTVYDVMKYTPQTEALAK